MSSSILKGAERLGPFLIVTAQIRGRRPMSGRLFYRFFCPGCDDLHHFEVGPWSFNGDPSFPTFSPRLEWSARCALWLQEAHITYARRCRHHLAGRLVPLVPSEQWL